ncbi:MAG: hypothetical protein AAF549_02250 [Pseudomonadota bacterium]
MKPDKPYNTESGNILFYILIAVVLLAALTYAVSNSTRTNTSTISIQQAKIAAQELTEYGQILTEAVSKLLLRKCRDDDISFEHPDLSDEYDNFGAPDDNRCHVFQTNGGNVNLLEIQPNWIDPDARNLPSYQVPLFSGSHCVIGSGEEECREPELTVLVGYLQKEVCSEINRLFNNPDMIDPDGILLTEDMIFNGRYSLFSEIDGDINIEGRLAGCVETNDSYTFYQVLLPRG